MEEIIDLELGVFPEAAVSGAVLVQTEYCTFLTFNAQKETEKRSPYGGYYTEDAGTAVIEFERCIITKFGHPNDEAAANMPQYKELDISYGICEVLNSNWILDLERNNSYSFPNTDYSDFRHFLIFFHDSTFECVARKINLVVSSDSYEKIMSCLSKKLIENK